MKKALSMKGALSLFAAAACLAASSGLHAETRLKGRLGSMLDSMVARHVAATDVDYITAPFFEKTETRGWWQTEFWGKWMHSAVPYLTKLEIERGECGIAEELRSGIERGIARILASQEECGYIGNYPDDLRCGEGWDVWGVKYTMMGLIHYFDYVETMERGKTEEGRRSGKTGESSWLPPNAPSSMSSAEVLAACRRLCDYVIAEIGPGGRRGRELWETGNWSGYASSSILEPVVWLYRRTGESRYLDFAGYVIRGMSEPEAGPRLVDLALKGVSVADRNGHGNKPESHGGYVMKHNRWKAYEMMSCYQGILEYCETLSDATRPPSRASCPVPIDDLRRAAVMTAEDIAKEEINLAGGCTSSEAWFHGSRKQHLPYVRLQETCVTITWMRLCEKLLETTGDPKWADELERTFYNAYLAALKPDGSEFAGYTPLSGSRYHGQHQCYMHTDCCNANGPRGYLSFLHELFRAKDGAATFNFYASALVRERLPSGKTVAFDMYSLYPRTGRARIVSHTEGAGMFPMRLRIPAWCPDARVRLNGTALEGAKGGSYFTIPPREWKLGDIVEISFAMPVTAHVAAGHAAFTRGPVLLARDSRFGDGDLSEPLRRGGVRDGATMHAFAAVRPPSDDMWMAFSATLPVGAHHENPEGANPATVFFCDYASAGNTWRAGDFYRTWFPIERSPAE